MENYEKFFKNFERPPFAPIYRPTEEEFADPIAYVATIRPEAEKYGVVKIVPPESFKPPFAIDQASFEFTPRVQRLAEIEAAMRERVMFLETLTTFWSLQGQQFRVPLVDGKLIDMYKLNLIVEANGGEAATTNAKKWMAVAKKLGVRNAQGGSTLKNHYKRWIAPYNRHVREKNVAKKEEPSSEEEGGEEEVDEKECHQTMQGRRRRPQGRMMAGGAGKQKTRPPSRKVKEDPLALVACSVCHRGDDEEHLMLCEECMGATHIQCCDPPMTEVPKGEWRCSGCISRHLDSLATGFGFYDAQTTYNLITFGDFAHKFKKEYFKKEPSEVPDEVVEKEFWKNILDTERNVAVKYGADLMVSKVGSGFPRTCDELRGPDAKLKKHYATHPWNLNNLPVLRDSVLSHIESGISGMMVPWVYVGMCFSTFCWHTEDHWTYSINYNHWGERKIWYGVSGDDAPQFEDTVRSMAPGLFSKQRDLLHHMTTTVNPAMLRAKGVDVWTVHQNAGEFVITFPRAYHAGFNEGLNFAEAVNFAPLDWLRMGRLCVADYSLVRRMCVFSHEELVLKMVQACDKLEIAMSIAALEELVEMCRRESARRSQLATLGVCRSRAEQFEKMGDDARTCRHCKTTVFLSALTCAHERTVCADHWDHLCHKCPIEECILRYRYTMDELLPMMTRLRQRTTEYFEWKEQVDNVLGGEAKPMLAAVERLLESARRRHFPHAAPLVRLIHINKACSIVLHHAHSLIDGKVRTRNKTRCQRADTRLDMDGVKQLLENMHALPCDVSDVAAKVKMVVDRIHAWCEEADRAIDQAAESSATPCEETMRAVLERGEQFDVRLPQLHSLQQALELVGWRRRADKILSWRVRDGMEDEDDFETRGRWSTGTVLGLVDEGARLLGGGGGELTAQLHSIMKKALANEALASRLMEGTGGVDEEELDQVWQRCRETDWCTDKGHDALRVEVAMVREIRSRTRGEEVCLSLVTQAARDCRSSRALAHSPLATRITQLKHNLEALTAKMIRLFEKAPSYYNLVEVMGGRDDLAALVEGRQSPLTLRRADDPIDEWYQLEELESCAEVSKRGAELSEQLRNLLPTLRERNATRPVNETCCCMGAGPSDGRTRDRKERAERQRAHPHDATLACLLCRARFHGECVVWEQLLGRLPPGTFLCMRCLRGKRPCVEDVHAAVTHAPPNALETRLARDSLERARHASRQAMHALAHDSQHPPDEHRLASAVYDVLSSEVLDMDVFPLVAAVIPRIAPWIEEQKAEWEALRERPARECTSLWSKGGRSGGKRGAGGGSGKKAKKTRGVLQKDEEPCSAGQCLRPFSEQVGWIQCEAGCERWYHYVCVGLTSQAADSLHAYACYKCKPDKE